MTTSTNIIETISSLLKSNTGKKMIASLTISKDMDNSRLSEFNWINELPLAQQELFDTIYQALDYSRIDLALRLIGNKKL